MVVRRTLTKPELLPSAVADLLREKVVNGVFAPGQRLVEASLADELDVSRGTVRDSLKELEDEGLIENIPRRGTYVVDLGPVDVREVYDLRAAIEMRAVRLVVERGPIGAPQVQLRQIIERIEKAVAAGDGRRAQELDMAFHGELYRLSDSRRLEEAFRRILPVMRLVNRSRHQLFPTLADVPREHMPLVEAIESGSIDGAEEAIDHHLAHARDLLVEHFDELRALQLAQSAARNGGGR
ncbi:MAG: GntR family transcriptional regulator [Candidatus Limnocylindrales bacterium]